MLYRLLIPLFLLIGCSMLLAPAAAQDSDAASDATAEIDNEPGDSHEKEDDHSDAGHDEEHDTDFTHSNMSDDAYAVTEFRADMAFFSALVFLILLVGLTAVAWKPIMDGLEKRERNIADNIANAEKASSEAEAKLADYESKLASAAEEAQQIVAEARKDAEAAGQKLVAAAQEEAAAQRDRAASDIESAKRVALSELATKSTDVAMSLAQRVVGREVKADDHQGLIQEMISKLPSNN